MNCNSRSCGPSPRNSMSPIRPSFENALMQGHVHCVRLSAANSADLKAMVEAVLLANAQGGRVEEVHLSYRCPVDAEVVQMLLTSKSISKVTLPNAKCLNCVDFETLKGWLQEGAVQYLQFAEGAVDGVRDHNSKMAEIDPLLVRHRELAAASKV